MCYKTESIAAIKRPAPPTPTKDTETSVTNDIQQQIDRLKLYPDPKNNNNGNSNPIPPPRNKRISSTIDDEYEIINPGYQLSPNRPAPPAPSTNGNSSTITYPDVSNDSIPYDTHTLYYASAAEMLGVPFKVNSLVKKESPVMVRKSFFSIKIIF